MKIKHSFIAIISVIVILFSCKKEEVQSGTPFLEVSPLEVIFNTDGTAAASDEVTIKSNRDWGVTADVDVVVTPSKGKNNGVFKISALPAIKEGQYKEYKLTVSIANSAGVIVVKTVTVKQGEEGGSSSEETSGKDYVFDGTKLPENYEQAGLVEVEGAKFSVVNVANFTKKYSDSKGPVQFKKGGSYLANINPISDLSRIVITLAPKGSQFNNFKVFVGTEAVPNTAEVEVEKTGDVCVYTIPAGNKFFAIRNISDYTSYAFEIAVDCGEEGDYGTGGGTPEPDPDPNPGDGKLPTDPADIELAGGNSLNSTPSNGTFAVSNATFEYSKFYYNTKYGSYTIDSKSGGYLRNLTEMNGLTHIVAIDDYQYYNLSLYVGVTVDAVTTKVSETKDGDNKIYAIPTGMKFFKFVNESNYGAQADKFTFYYESLGATVEGAEFEEEFEVAGVEYTFDDFWKAAGYADADAANEQALTGVEFTDFTVTSDKGSATTAFRFWASDNTIRSYAGNTVTITAKNGKKVKGVLFSHSEISAVTVGNMTGKSWKGDADAVTLTLTKAANKSIKIDIK